MIVELDCFRKYVRVNNLVFDIKGHVIKKDLQHDKNYKPYK